MDVTDVGSLLQTGGVTVGSGTSNGTLRIEKAGRVASGRGQLAYDSGSTGAATVTGTGSSWINDENLLVGGHYDFGVSRNGGSGTLRIQSGGLVQASTLKFFSGGELTVDNGTIATPGLLLVGGGQAIPAGGTLGDLVIGKTTAARMEVRTGGTVANNNALLGASGGSSGSALVTDPGSQWNNGGTLTVGNQGDGTLEARNGGAVISGISYVGFAGGAVGNATVSGSGSSWSVAGNLIIGGGAAGTLKLDNGGTVTATLAAVFANGYLNLGANPVLNAPLTFYGGAIQFVDVSNTSFPNDITLGSQGVQVSVYTYGHPSILSGSLTGSGGLVKGGSGNIGLGTLTLTGNSTYTAATTVNAGTLSVNGSISSPVTVNNGATLGGNGAVGSVTINSGGILAPGNSPGKLTINGNYTQNSGGILNIEIGGSTPGTGGYDQLVVTGTASLNGTLNLSLVNGYRPAVGDTFNIIASGAETGSFSAINSTGFTVTPAATASGIKLTVKTVQQGVPIISSATSASATQGQPFSYQIGIIYLTQVSHRHKRRCDRITSCPSCEPSKRLF